MVMMDDEFSLLSSTGLSSIWGHLASRGLPSLKLQDFYPRTTESDLCPTLLGAELRAATLYPIPTV